MSVADHPQFQPGMVGIVLLYRPDAGPVRASIGACADQVEGLPALTGLGREIVLEQYDGGPVPAGEPGPDPPGGLTDRGCEAGLGDDGQVAGLSAGGQPHTQVRNALRGPGGKG